MSWSGRCRPSRIQPPSAKKKRKQSDVAPEPIPAQESVAVEERLLADKVATHFCLVFDHVPIWLLIMDPTFVASVVTFGVDNIQELTHRLEGQPLSSDLLLAAVARLGATRVTYTTSPEVVPDDAVWLVSGGLATATALTSTVPPNARSLCIIDHPLRGKPRLPKDYSWQTVQHLHFGGATTFRTSFGARNVAVTPAKTTLRCTLAHVIDFGEPAYDTPNAESYSLDDRLHPASLDRQMHYRTHQSQSRWGNRRLTVGELGVTFGIPSCFRHSDLPRQLFPFVPLQILDGILEGLVNTRVAAPAQVAKIPRIAIPIPEN
jgi:hypothetical protein